jgi:hypothetical protein
MKTITGVLAALALLTGISPAAAMGGGGFHGGGFHGGHFHDGHFHGAPFFGFGLGFGWGYPWYPAYYSYSAADDFAFTGPVIPQPAGVCGTWIWHPETYSYGWLACGATSEVNVQMAPPAQPVAP